MHTAYRRTIAGLAFFQVVHALGLLTMLGVLLPGIDPALPYAMRAGYVQEHAWLWRIGWLPWQLCALSDLWVTLALATFARNRWSLAACALLSIAIVPEQLAEAYLISGYASAPSAERLRQCMWWTGTWAASGYTLMTACWLGALRERARGWRSFELIILGAFAASGFANHFAWYEREDQSAFLLASALNGIGFSGLFVIGFRLAMLAGEHRLGQPAPPANLLDSFARSAGLRDLLRPLPFPRLASDIRDVVYLNWLVPADALQALIPGDLRIRRYGDTALLSALVYRHGHFGPALLGPLRRLLPSPVQCNVRAYLEAPALHVAFVANSIDNGAYVLGSRLLSDGLPAQRTRPAVHRSSERQIEIQLEPAPGSELGLRASVERCEERSLPAEFARVFADWQSAIQYIVPQNAAVRRIATLEQVCVSEIIVDVKPGSEEPARIVDCQLTAPLAGLVGGRTPFVFVLPSVGFAVLGERMSGD